MRGGIALGGGRSGFVFKVRDASGRPIARKIFDSGPLTKAVQVLLLGAPNPYAWDADAVRAAVLRRRILARLVRHWFGDRLRVARAWRASWNADYRAWQIDLEFVEGRPPALHHPMTGAAGAGTAGSGRAADEVTELLTEVMPPLQARLAEAGFDGVLWQAGLANPVALGNFLLETGPDARARWAWIDLESGVPALFPASPRALFARYLPLSWRHRRPLYDDVDVERLAAWLDRERAALERSGGIGKRGWKRLAADARSLARYQAAWKSRAWHERGIDSQLAKGLLGRALAEHYRRRPLLWFAREARRLPAQAARESLARAVWHLRRLRALPWRSLPRSLARFSSSQDYRSAIARRLVEHRIGAWEAREQLDAGEARLLRERLAEQESSAWLSDFGVHLAIKPFVKLAEYSLIPLLYASGSIHAGGVWLALLAGGPLARTAYTAYRVAQAAAAGRERPWTALAVGTLPVLGNLAYPAQIAWSSKHADQTLAQFILYDGCTTLGRKLPIWGGPDTLTEHAFNHLPDRIVASRGRAEAPTAADTDTKWRSAQG